MNLFAMEKLLEMRSVSYNRLTQPFTLDTLSNLDC